MKFKFVLLKDLKLCWIIIGRSNMSIGYSSGGKYFANRISILFLLYTTVILKTVEWGSLLYCAGTVSGFSLSFLKWKSTRPTFVVKISIYFILKTASSFVVFGSIPII
jgi:hypothetical protein